MQKSSGSSSKVEERRTATYRVEEDTFRPVEELDLLGLVVLEETAVLDLLELGFGHRDPGDARVEAAEDDLERKQTAQLRQPRPRKRKSQMFVDAQP